MFSKNPLRNASPVATTAAVNLASQLQVTLPQLQTQLQSALQRISALETRLAQLELTFYVAPNGDVEIYSPTSLHLYSGRDVHVSGARSAKLSDDSGSSIVLESGSVKVATSGNMSIQCSKFDVSAGTLTASVPLSDFSGTVKTDTLIANSVVGSSYTPGAGNIW